MKKVRFSCFFVLLVCCDGSVLDNILSSREKNENGALSYLMSREQVFQMLVDGANLTDGRGAKSLGELAGALASLAQGSLESGNTTNAIDPATVASVRNLVQLFISQLVIEHNESVNLEHDTSGFTVCAENITTTLTTTGINASKKEGENCSVCWEETKEIQVVNETCFTNLTYYQGPMYEACEYFNGTNRKISEVQAERCSETWSKSYEDYLERDILLLAELTYARENCTNLSDLMVNETKICKNQSSSIAEKMKKCLDCEMQNTSNITEDSPGDSTDCVVVPERKVMCDEYEMCYSSAKRTYNKRCADQTTMAIARKAEYRALMRINCLLNVLVVEVSEEYVTLVDCINTTYSTAELNIICEPPPAPLPCSSTVCT